MDNERTILDLTHEEARNFLLKDESYFTLDLPTYFQFSDMLVAISQQLENKDLSEFYFNKKKPGCFEDVNYKLFNNKDGEYAWRLFQLIHPVLYASLVNKITEKLNWETITQRFTKLKTDAIVECVSLPVVPSDKQQSDKAAQVSTWWHKTEQKSIMLALEYDYIFHVDIANCYGTIYTHSIPWALHTKEKEKKKRKKRSKNGLIGNIIDWHLQGMSNSQTNGIPEGSVLMDFIAEMVLGYVDCELTKNIKYKKSERYRIIRYRDDYRIFVNNPQTGKNIIKELSIILSESGMRLNSEKTKHSSDIISSSIKPDKLSWLENGVRNNNLQKQLLALYRFSKKYPNSGTLNSELQHFYDNIEKLNSITDDTEVLVSILSNIAFRNPKAYPVAFAIISQILNFMENQKKKKISIEKIKNRFRKLPNTEYLDIWLQRISIKIDSKIKYERNLCKKVSDNSIEIWNSEWLEANLKKIISSAEIVNKQKIEDSDAIISREEVALFKKNNYY